MATQQANPRDVATLVANVTVLSKLAGLRKAGLCPLCGVEKVQVSLTLNSNSQAEGVKAHQAPVRACIQCAYALMQAGKLGRVIFLDPLKKRGRKARSG